MSFDNSILREEKDKRRSDFAFFPAILINNVPFLGTWNPENFLEAVCSGFKKSPNACLGEKTIASEEGSIWTAKFIVFLVFLFLVINIIIFYFCRRYIEKRTLEALETNDINTKINSLVTNYLALKDENK